MTRILRILSIVNIYIGFSDTYETFYRSSALRSRDSLINLA